MYPLCAFSARLKISTNYCGIIEIWIIMYSSLTIWLFRYKSFTPIHMYLDLTYDMALFIWSFTVVKSDVYVLTSPG